MTDKELTIAIRFTTDADGHITSITFPDTLPVMELTYMQTFLACLERAKVSHPTCHRVMRGQNHNP